MAVSANFLHTTSQGVIAPLGSGGGAHYSHSFSVAKESFEVVADLGSPGGPFFIDKRMIDGRVPFLRTVSRVSCPQRWRAASTEGKGREPVAFVLTPRVGRAKIVHAGNEVELKPGQYTVCVSSEPNISYFSADSEVLIGFIPDPGVVQDRHLTRHIGKERPVEGVACLLLQHLDRALRIAHTLDAAGLAAASGAAEHLLPAALCAGSSFSPQHADVLLDRVKTYIESMLHESELGAHQIAAAHYVSVRTVYRLFNKSDQSVVAYIRAKRMERCRADLERRLDLSIVAICRRWGISDPKHFSRQYRAQFGESPSETRRRMHGPREAAAEMRA